MLERTCIFNTSRDCVATKQSVPLARNEKCASRPPDHESFVTGALGNTWRRIKLWTLVGAAIGVPAGVGMNLSVLIAIRVVLWFELDSLQDEHFSIVLCVQVDS